MVDRSALLGGPCGPQHEPVDPLPVRGVTAIIDVQGPGGGTSQATTTSVRGDRAVMETTHRHRAVRAALRPSRRRSGCVRLEDPQEIRRSVDRHVPLRPAVGHHCVGGSGARRTDHHVGRYAVRQPVRYHGHGVVAVERVWRRTRSQGHETSRRGEHVGDGRAEQRWFDRDQHVRGLGG